MVRAGNLFTSVVDITHDYLGPAADRFVIRQIRNHLHKEPERLARADLADLIDWIRVSMSFLTDDEVLIDAYIHELKSLLKGRS